jgi:hypothetical protein
MRKPVIGETLYILNIGNNARHTPQVLKPCKVEVIGRKYFTVEVENQGYGSFKHEFTLGDWKQATGGYDATYALYEIPQQWEDQKERRNLLQKISQRFEYGYRGENIPLANLRKIATLMEETDKQPQP